LGDEFLQRLSSVALKAILAECPERSSSHSQANIDIVSAELGAARL